MTQTNRFIKLVKRPEGRPTPEIFSHEEAPIAALKSGEFLIKNLILSMDPALVGRMRDEDNYTESVNPGEVMHAYGVGQVIESKHNKVKVGELRFGRLDMQEYAVCKKASEYRKINAGLADPSWYLSVVGITGATAYFSLYDVCKPKQGETILISAGGSSVGSVVAQLAKYEGCRTVAIVSTDAKAEEVKKEWGYDAAVSYRGKSIEELSRDLGYACPNGVDIYYDNTSGDISEAVMDHYNDFARIAVIGRLGITHLSDTRLDTGRRDNNLILAKRITKQGFVLLDYQSKIMGAILKLAKMLKQGELKIKEDYLHGIDQTPAAFFRMLDGESKGKQLVKLGEVNDQLDPSPRWLGNALTAEKFPTTPLVKLLTGGIA